MTIRVSPLAYPSVGALPMEIAERKVLGRPDTLSDALRARIIDLARGELDGIDRLWRDAVAGTLELW